jgi:hypothetical protein
MSGFDEIAGLTEAKGHPSNFDALAGLSEMEGGHFARTKRANIAASRALRTAAAQAEYDKTGKVPEGFKMVFGQIKGGPWEHPIKVATTPAEVAQAAQAMTGQPAAPAQVVRQKITKMPPPGLGRRGGFFKNIANGHVKADDLAPEFWESLPPYEKKKVEDALAKAGGVKPVVSDVDFNHMVSMMEATSFDEMCGLAEGSRGKAKQHRTIKKIVKQWNKTAPGSADRESAVDKFKSSMSARFERNKHRSLL